jgi:hypothetical protein
MCPAMHGNADAWSKQKQLSLLQYPSSVCDLHAAARAWRCSLPTPSGVRTEAPGASGVRPSAADALELQNWRIAIGSVFRNILHPFLFQRLHTDMTHIPFALTAASCVSGSRLATPFVRLMPLTSVLANFMFKIWNALAIATPSALKSLYIDVEF